MTFEEAALEAYAEGLDAIATVEEVHGDEPRLPHQTLGALNVFLSSFEAIRRTLALESDGATIDPGVAEEMRQSLRDFAGQLLMIYATSGWAFDADAPTTN